MPSIFPSLISSDLLNLGNTIKNLDPYCAGYHIDIMDNHFVPSLTWGTPFVEAISQATSRQLWVHLMVDNPASFIAQLEPIAEPIVESAKNNLNPNGLKKNIISFHLESTNNPLAVIQAIQEKKWRPSMAINPKTPVTDLIPFFPFIDHLLLMSVHPGKSGQPFIPETINKIIELQSYLSEYYGSTKKNMRQSHNSAQPGHLLEENQASAKPTNTLSTPITLALDGGITLDNYGDLAKRGVDHFAIASAIFNTPDPTKTLRKLQNYGKTVDLK